MKPSQWVPLFVMGFLLGLGSVLHAQGGALVDNYSVKVGVAYSESFIQVTRTSDDSVAELVADSDYSPHLSFATPPFFLGDSGLALGVSASYAQFTASQQEFPTEGPASIGSTVEGRMLILTPSVSYTVGRTSPTQFLRIAFGAGWAWADISGRVQFGDTLNAESSEPLEAQEGVSNAVLFSLEYRLGPLSLAFMGGGPKIETPSHSIIMGEDSIVLAWVINF